MPWQKPSNRCRACRQPCAVVDLVDDAGGVVVAAGPAVREQAGADDLYAAGAGRSAGRRFRQRGGAAGICWPKICGTMSRSLRRTSDHRARQHADAGHQGGLDRCRYRRDHHEADVAANIWWSGCWRGWRRQSRCNRNSASRVAKTGPGLATMLCRCSRIGTPRSSSPRRQSIKLLQSGAGEI